MENEKPCVVICNSSQTLVVRAIAALLEEYKVFHCLAEETQTRQNNLPKRADLVIRCAPSTYCPLPHNNCRYRCSKVPELFIAQTWLESEEAVRGAHLSGYIGPGCTPEQVAKAAKTLLEGGFYYHPGNTKQAAVGRLSKRQVEVLSLIGLGLTDQEIASKLGIEETTVRHHLQTLYDKLHIERRGEAAALAALGGLTRLGPHSELRYSTF
jgi:DNA-binding CsgD family transcriptional regulator